jgi:hypothetical protein
MTRSLAKILVTVMTYPHPSRNHQELVCTAGVTEAGEWVRLYPNPHRYNPGEKQFHKYQWIELELEERGMENDNRKESHRPTIETLRILGQPLSVANGWAERRAIIDGLPHHTMKELTEQYSRDGTSLGIVRPAQVLDMKIEKTATEWKPKWQALFSQLRLFGPPQKPLRKIPYAFRYVFTCEDSDKPYKRLCEDWELGMLFLNESERLGSDEKAAESVRHKFFDEMCNQRKDTRFFMGTVFPYNTWIVLGIFWPPKLPATRQLKLF